MRLALRLLSTAALDLPITDMINQSLRPGAYNAEGRMHLVPLQVMDSLVVSLCKWTTLLDPNVPKPTVAFGEHPKACMAMEVVFQVANR